jgi:hypothetical protein
MSGIRRETVEVDPPPVLRQENLRVERRVESGQVVTRYVDKTMGQPVPLAETFHLPPLKPGSFDPPPS